MFRGSCVVLCKLELTYIISDSDARLIKRQKQSHPRLGPLREAGALLVGSQRVGKVGRRKFNGRPPPRKNHDNDNKSKSATIITASGKVGASGGGLWRVERRTSVGMGETGPQVNSGEVCEESFSPSLSWPRAEHMTATGQTHTMLL
jgi:hypothetical protein